MEFLTDIQRRGPRAFKVLIQALLDTNQSHCADWLDPNGEISRSAPVEAVPTPHRSREHSQQPVGMQESTGGSSLSSFHPRDEVDDSPAPGSFKLVFFVCSIPTVLKIMI